MSLTHLNKKYLEAQHIYQEKVKDKACKITLKLLKRIEKAAAKGKSGVWYDPWWFEFIHHDVVESIGDQLRQQNFHVEIRNHYDSVRKYLIISGWNHE